VQAITGPTATQNGIEAGDVITRTRQEFSLQEFSLIAHRGYPDLVSCG
jgi:hypothetical protein